MSASTAATTYQYNDPVIKSDDNMKIVGPGRRDVACSVSLVICPAAQVVVAAASVFGLAITSIVMAACSFIAMFIAHLRNPDVHNCGDYFVMLSSRNAFSSDDSWIG